MKILMTGSTGFIGRNLASLGVIHRHIVRSDEKHDYQSFFTIDSLGIGTDWDGAFDGIDVVIHLAGLAHSNRFSDHDYESVNVAGALRLAREASEQGARRFVFVSSIGVNGTCTSKKRFSVNSSVNPHNAYAKSKYKAELGLKKIAEETGLEVVIVRPTLVYGPGAPGNFGMLTKLVAKLPFVPFGLANNRRDFIAVQNLADLLVTCAIHPDASGHTFLASDGETVSIKEFTNAIAYGLGKKVVQLPVPVSVMRLVGKLTGKSAMIEQLYGHLEVDSSNIKEVLGWTPPLTMKEAMATLRDSGVK
ncbi:TPA: NAD-dependent epimerase/dehydratase family protein [Vibrio parahaemolyticus]|uniref:UDP-glucose 4-epimerase n=2 Tax=Vibrio harveyi group TaxID=717610 RepID=A0A5P4S6Q4_VIBPH|nr:NAD-dependent epimerase/dehydratase family protein [Vibrio parahaemolyticus]EGQ8128965.1 NAD-dependent epimerase/dehydratase family protein [Vibrio parahaemolyticus]EGQ8177011.1 NAD-dependent epimerase/dehydratase family protein [Vibrio parahaemolyticus]EGQ8278576.1 NAD-dependent epimerase/dehydratase family protein [Vibrio parahaemolyticus]EGQ8717340.1 NAD-dependent epimerase/dehydratase family protein [Vibrio parahaemolyticus]EGQ8810732.1 NAD-dependent epimerase/dehydratase family protein